MCVCEEIQRGGQKTYILQSGTHGAGQKLDTTAIIIRYPRLFLLDTENSLFLQDKQTTVKMFIGRPGNEPQT